ncbi:hypothetical protein [uncultured Oscillibacter sp.]|uniref:hypothetical protein n=1 Tax=uncultured Oscillibacter sp. TaxID=876091 RepID=UPI002624746A|nr:hypothetical protein [uncultured Oscillibacter sp.]
MRAILDAKAFSEALSNVSKVIQKSAFPVLEGVLVRFKDGRCSLTGSDFTTWLTVSLPARGENFAFVLPKPLAAVKVCRYFTGELALEMHDVKSEYPTVTLTSGHRSGTFDAFQEKNYAPPPPLEETVSFTVNAAALLKRIERVKYAVQEPKNYSYQAERTCVQFSGNDVFCVDGHRAACDTDPALTVPRPFLTWGNALSHLKLMGGGEATIRIGTKHIWITTDAVTICTRREGFEPFRLRSAVPGSFPEEFFVSPKEFLQELEYLEGFQPRKHRRTVCFCGGQLFFDKAESTCSTSVNIEGESKITVGFDQRFMKDALRQFKDEPRVRMKISGEISPIILEAEGRNDFAMVLPVRLSGRMAA